MNDVTSGTVKSASDEAPKKPRTKLWITLGIAGVMLVALVGAGLAWHQSPTFCNAVCHNPMEGYVKGYSGGSDALLITKHASGAKALKCLDCHESTVGQQLTEASHWATGDFAAPLAQRDLGTRALCLASGCHSDKKIVAATADYRGAAGFNPHDPRHGKLQCYRCHSMHGVSTLVCNECHNLELPKGWAQPAGKATASK